MLYYIDNNIVPLVLLQNKLLLLFVIRKPILTFFEYVENVIFIRHIPILD